MRRGEELLGPIPSGETKLGVYRIVTRGDQDDDDDDDEDEEEEVGVTEQICLSCLCAKRAPNLIFFPIAVLRAA